jgi:hypothetical protein
MRFLRFLGKVQFTMVLLLGGVVIMTAGTILESRESREVAQSLVYGAAWFDVFLFLIATNLVAAVINRIPIKRQQWSFVLTHFSIVLLLTGAWVSRTFGYEGRLAIREGSEESRIVLDSFEVRARWPAGAGQADLRAGEARFPLPRTPGQTRRTLQAEGAERPGIRIVDYVPDGVASTGLGEGGEADAPGIHFLLASEPGHDPNAAHDPQPIHDHQWLIAGSPRFERRDVGPLEVEFVIVRSRELFESRSLSEDASGVSLFVHRKDGGAPCRILLPASVGQEIPCGPDLVAKVEKFLMRARLVKGELADVPNVDLNPAVIVEIRSGGRTETRTVFSRFPEFDAVHGREQGEKGQEGDSLVEKLRLDAPSLLSKPLVSVLLGPDQQLHVQLSTAAGRQPARPLSVGQRVALGDLGLALEVKGFLASAKPEITIQPSAKGRETGNSFIRLEASLGAKSESRWLGLGSSGQWILDGHTVEMAYARQTRPLPFAIALEAFELIHHPGSKRPAEYRSVVTVRPLSADLPPRREVISMNRPLDEAGFRLFQSSYRLGQGRGPDMTVLSVSRDPGVPIVYSSFGLIVLGIAWYVSRQGRKRKPSAPVPPAPDEPSGSEGRSGPDESAADPGAASGDRVPEKTGRHSA